MSPIEWIRVSMSRTDSLWELVVKVGLEGESEPFNYIKTLSAGGYDWERVWTEIGEDIMEALNSMSRTPQHGLRRRERARRFVELLNATYPSPASGSPR